MAADSLGYKGDSSNALQITAAEETCQRQGSLKLARLGSSARLAREFEYRNRPLGSSLRLLTEPNYRALNLLVIVI